LLGEEALVSADGAYVKAVIWKMLLTAEKSSRRLNSPSEAVELTK